MRAQEFVSEKWSKKYKRSINCADLKGFSQRAHCQGRKKHDEDLSEDDLEEQLYFKGSPCTVDCSGHKAGYEWWQRKRRVPNSWSPSFNNGATLASQGK